MKIAIIGYGNMGKAVEEAARAKKYDVVSISFKNRNDMIDREGIKKADVVIEFTSSKIVLRNIKEVLSLQKPIVVGTSGWYDKMDEVSKMVKKYKGGFIYGQNFSIGANIFFLLADRASVLFNRFPQYDVYGFEVHHAGKKDSPSGTAKKLTKIILARFESKRKEQFDRVDRKIEADEFHFASVRAGKNFGTHKIVFDSQSDEIDLTISARGRTGYAEGALFAAEFIRNKKGLYSFEDVFAKEVK